MTARPRPGSLGREAPSLSKALLCKCVCDILNPFRQLCSPGK